MHLSRNKLIKVWTIYNNNFIVGRPRFYGSCRNISGTSQTREINYDYYISTHI